MFRWSHYCVCDASDDNDADIMLAVKRMCTSALNIRNAARCAMELKSVRFGSRPHHLEASTCHTHTSRTHSTTARPRPLRQTCVVAVSLDVWHAL